MADRRTTARDLAQIAVFAALIAAMGLAGQLTIGAGLVPITMQSLGVMLTGAILGPRKGGLAVLTCLAVGLLGVPVLSGGRNTWHALAGPSVGYIIGWIAGAVVIGLLTRIMITRLGRYAILPGLLINLLGGIGVIYLLGIPGVALRSDIGLAPAAIGALPFLIGDAVKVVVATAVAAGVHKAYPGLTGAPRPTKVAQQ